MKNPNKKGPHCFCRETNWPWPENGCNALPDNGHNFWFPEISPASLVTTHARTAFHVQTSHLSRVRYLPGTQNIIRIEIAGSMGRFQVRTRKLLLQLYILWTQPNFPVHQIEKQSKAFVGFFPQPPKHGKCGMIISSYYLDVRTFQDLRFKNMFTPGPTMTGSIMKAPFPPSFGQNGFGHRDVPMNFGATKCFGGRKSKGSNF